jgi:hypothetical protein
MKSVLKSRVSTFLLKVSIHVCSKMKSVLKSWVSTFLLKVSIHVCSSFSVRAVCQEDLRLWLCGSSDLYWGGLYNMSLFTYVRLFYRSLFAWGLSAKKASGCDYAGLRISMEEVSIVCLFSQLLVSFIGHYFHKDCLPRRPQVVTMRVFRSLLRRPLL